MFYISKVLKNKIYVVDTKDEVEDKVQPIELLKAERMGFNILGLYHSKGRVYFCTYTADLVKISMLQKGTPVRIRLSEGLGFNQTLYIGHEFKDGKDIFYFFDDSGMDGYFGLSSDYITSNDKSICFDFDNNDTLRVTTLTRRLKDIGGIL